MPSRPYAGKWPKVRLKVLERDGWLCQIRGPGCTVKATCVDHIVEVLSGGSWWDESNLRAACVTCNNRRIGQHGSRRWQAARTYITLVTGPPDADLLQYVRTHAQPSDLVIDHTALARSLGSSTAATTARNTLLNQLRQGKVSNARAWITSSNPNAASTLPHHRVVVREGVAQPQGGSPTGGMGPVVAPDTWQARRQAVATAAPTASRAW